MAKRTAFQDEATVVLGHVREAFGALVSALDGPSRAIDIERALQIDKKLAWRVHRIATARETLDVANFAVQKASTRRLLEGARQAGVTQAIVDQVADATERFEQFVADHAPDRVAFNAMIADLNGGDDEGTFIEARRAAFRSNTIIYGLFADVSIFSFILTRGSKAGVCPAVTLRGPVQLKRLRSSAALEISKHRFDRDGEPIVERSRPLDEEAFKATGVPIVPQFSSTPLPRLSDVEDRTKFRRTYLQSRDVGTRAAVTCMLGEYQPDFPDDEEAFGSLFEVSYPTRVLIHDFLVEEDVLDLEDVQSRVVGSRRFAQRWPDVDSPDLLPCEESVVRLGSLESAFTPDWPEYRNLLHWTLDTLGWSDRRFAVYRMRIEYPVMHSVVWLRAARRGR